MYEIFTLIYNEYTRLGNITPLTNHNNFIEVTLFCNAHENVYYRVINDAQPSDIIEDLKSLYKEMKDNFIEKKTDFVIRID